MGVEVVLPESGPLTVRVAHRPRVIFVIKDGERCQSC
jgi:hypothetical protein